MLSKVLVISYNMNPSIILASDSDDQEIQLLVLWEVFRPTQSQSLLDAQPRETHISMTVLTFGVLNPNLCIRSTSSLPKRGARFPFKSLLSDNSSQFVCHQSSLMSFILSQLPNQSNLSVTTFTKPRVARKLWRLCGITSSIRVFEITKRVLPQLYMVLNGTKSEVCVLRLCVRGLSGICVKPRHHTPYNCEAPLYKGGQHWRTKA